MLEVGRIVRAHGIRGEVLVELVTNRPERLAAGSVLSTDVGDLRVTEVRPHQGRWITTFDGVIDRSGAEALRGVVLRADALDEPDELWVHQLIGSEVVDQSGTSCGKVTAVQANPASDLLVLDGGALVPLTFVISAAAGRVVIDPPEGLLDL